MPYINKFNFETPDGPRVPFQGTATTARHASYTGARYAVVNWGVKQALLLALLAGGESFTDIQIAAVLGWPLSSVNSIRNSLSGSVEPEGFETVTWSEGRTTRRTKWRLRIK